MSVAQSRRLAEIARREASVPREQRLLSSLTPSAPISVIPKPKPVRLIDEMPEDKMIQWAWKLYTLMNLSWGYIDTILDLCVQMRLKDTRPLVRVIRDLRRSYDRFRARSIDSDHVAKETHNAEVFEEQFSSDFDRLFNGLYNEVSRLDLKPDHRSLVIATQQALTLMDAVKVFARMCDKEIKAHGIWTCDCSLLQDEFQQLYPLIPQFAGDCYRPDLRVRQTTARILANRLASIHIDIKDRCLPKIFSSSNEQGSSAPTTSTSKTA